MMIGRTMDNPWPNVNKCKIDETEKERHNDSGVSPGSSSSEADSPVSPSIGAGGGSSNSPPSCSSNSNPLPSTSKSYPHSPVANGHINRLQMALENSSALSIRVFKSESDSQTGKRSPKSKSKKQHRCPLCAYTSPYKHRYIEHVVTHYSDKCTLCDFAGKTAKDLRTHLADVHNIKDLGDLVDPTDAANSDGRDDEEPPGKKSKTKTFKCKQCSFVTDTKLVFWDHSKTHIKVEKQLTCPHCPFVTEYKHHLEYHVLNHFGEKPFKCNQCDYSCVNKSMLNSHLKSHSNIYQYRCVNCPYVTKYCHSLKLHLRKYKHKPAMVLDSDGSPNPLPIIDIYGTRRGPKTKRSVEGGEASIEFPPNDQPNLPGDIVIPAAPQSSPTKYPFNNNNNNNNVEDEQTEKFAYDCNLCEYCTRSYILYAEHMTSHARDSVLSHIFPNNNNITDNLAVKDYFQSKYFNATILPTPPVNEQPQFSPAPNPFGTQQSQVSPPQVHTGIQPPQYSPLYLPVVSGPSDYLPQAVTPLDLSKHESKAHKNGHKATDGKKSRRKGKAYKLERPTDFLEVKMEVSDEDYKIKIPSFKPNVPENEEAPSQPSTVYSCSHCDISFKNVIMHTVHMGYHGFQDPFTCNMCGQETQDKVSFFLHIARSSHS